MTNEQEEKLLRDVALQNANSILLARQRAEQELIMAKEALELKTEELANSLAMMRATLESATDGILVTDVAGKVTGFNRRYVEMWKIPREVMDSREHRQLLEVHSRQLREPQGFLARIDDIYTSSPPESFDVLELADGRILERFSNIHFVDERKVGRVWSFRDITERKQAEEVRLRLAAVVESSDDAIVTKSLDGTIRTWNKAAERMFGYTAEEVIGQSILILIPYDREDEESKILERLRKGEPVKHYETVRTRKDGTIVDVSLTVSPIKEAGGKIIGASKIARDISERKRAEQERAGLTSILEKLLVSERSARDEAEQASAMKDEFLATLSHELRTPLSAILGWSQVLRRGIRDEADLHKGLDAIERSARVQSQLIEDLLDMNRITSGKLRLDVQPVAPLSFIEAAVETVRPAADAKGIRLEKLLDPAAGPISGDPNRLQQVVWNLLSNALKFTPRGGKVQVALERVNSHIEICVADTGIGIKPEFLPHVFERFRQADASTTRAYGGLGLGLAIVKQLVELHGGTVRVDSAGEDRGTTLTVRLPLAVMHRSMYEEARLHPKTPTSTSVNFKALDLSGIKVLVVDDEVDACELIKRVLTDCDAELFTACTASEALLLVARERPHVLVSDIGMPDVDGYELLSRVRALGPGGGGTVPAIALTAFARSEDRTRALRAGFLVHLSKPVEPSELIATVATIAGRTGAEVAGGL